MLRRQVRTVAVVVLAHMAAAVVVADIRGADSISVVAVVAAIPVDPAADSTSAAADIRVAVSISVAAILVGSMSAEVIQEDSMLAEVI
jgi:hypothetical protein